MVRLLKLSEGEDPQLSSDEILFIHLGYYMTYGKVAYSTDVKVAEKPDYVLLTIGNVDNICYLCHVSEYAYKEKDVNSEIKKWSLDRYKDEERATWFVFDSMQKIQIDFLDEVIGDNTICKFIQERANNKVLRGDRIN